MSEMREVRLPAELCSAAAQKYAARFKSLEELLEFVLRDLLRDEASKLDQAEQRAIEQRLRDLGYL